MRNKETKEKLKAPIKLKSPLEILTELSATNRIKEMEENLKKDHYIFPGMALDGQMTLFYAKPNTGKTLFFLHFLIEAIKEKRIQAGDIFYINADDHYKGLLKKSQIAEKYGFYMISPDEAEKTPSEIISILLRLSKTEDATGKIIILDTLKKFADMMNKKSQSDLYMMLRRLIAKNATVIIAGHANKHLDDNGSLIYEGTSDTMNDVDCAYSMYVTSKTGTDTVVEFLQEKSRGDVVEKVSYGYTKISGADYISLVDSVHELNDRETEDVVFKENKKAKTKKYESEVMFIKKILKEQQLNESSIVKTYREHKENTEKEYHSLVNEFTQNKLKKALNELTGTFWKMERDSNNNAKVYALLNNDYDDVSREQISNKDNKPKKGSKGGKGKKPSKINKLKTLK